MAQAWELAHDPNVVVLGEDVGKSGGVFRATAGLFEKFGGDRVQDTPLAENMIAGMCVGMAAQGMKPVAEALSDPASAQEVGHAGESARRVGPADRAPRPGTRRRAPSPGAPRP